MAKKTTPVQHTPGPWRVEFPNRPDDMAGIYADAPQYSSPGDDPWRVAYVLRDSNPHQQPIDDANARLIAAAPDLLRALKNALVELDVNGDSIGAVVDVLESEGRAAIAKAEGRS